MKNISIFRRTAALSCLAMFLSLVVRAEAVQVGQLYYNLNETDATASVAKHADYQTFTSVDIPGKITVNGKDYTVTVIGDQAFIRCTSLASVTIGEGVTEVKDWAFYGCAGITSLKLPSTLTTVRGDAFRNCTSLKTLVLPDNLSSIASSGFSTLSALEELTIGKNITSLGGRAFINCTSLKKVNFNDKLDSIGAGTFQNCGFTELVLPPTLAKAGTGAFNECLQLTSVTLPEAMTSIANEMFYKCRSLTRVVLPETLSSIGELAFGECNSLAEITLPQSLAAIGANCFYNCSALPSVNIPEHVSVINNGTFSGCSSLVSLSFPDGISEIGREAMSGCSKLASVKLPASLAKLGLNALKNCVALETIDLPGALTYIDENAFYGCSALKRLDIADKVTFIGNGFSIGCTSLAGIYVSSGNAKYCDIDGVLFNKEKTDLLAYPGGKKGDYSVPESTLRIDGYVFMQNTNLTGITFPNTLKNIGISNFMGCSNLKSVRLPEQLDSLGATSFFLDRNLAEIILPNNNVWIGNNALSGTGISTLLFPESIKEIGIDNETSTAYSVLGSCGSLTSISLPSTLEKMSPVGLNCTSLQTIYCFATVPPVLAGENIVEVAATVKVPRGTAAAYQEAWKVSYPNVKYEEVLPGAAVVTAEAGTSTLTWEICRDGLYTGMPERYVLALYEGTDADNRTLVGETALDANGEAGGSATMPSNAAISYTFPNVENGKAYSYELKGYTTRGELSVWHTGAFDGQASGIGNVEAHADIVSREYYDFNGRRVATPRKGLYIVRYILTDGTVRTGKQMFE